MAKKVLVRICIIVFIIGLMGFSDRTFAAESESDGLKILGMGLNLFVSTLGRIRVFFAKLAGTFLTNKRVYGEILGLDTLLWKYRNVIKNIANFGLGFYFVYVIFRGLINQGKEEITKKIKDIILWLLIAGVGIQASWFFVATVIDISTITLAAAGSFPSQVLSQSSYTEAAMKASLSKYLNSDGDVVQGWKISLFPKNQDANSLLDTKKVDLVSVESFTGLVDSLMPNADDVSGPLYFMGYTILETNVITSIDSSSDNGIKGTILNTLIQGGTTIVFAIEMLILCVLALIRIIYLWMFIVLSPLAVLIRCIGKSGEKLGNGEGFLSKFTSQISLKTFFMNVFKPTIIVLGFGVAVIFVAYMNKIVLDYENRPFDMKGMIIGNIDEPGSNANGNEGDRTSTVTFDNNFLHFTLIHSGKTFLELVLCILTVLIIYLIIDAAVRMGTGNDFVSKSIVKMQNGLEGIVKSAPVVPVPVYDEYGKKKEKLGGLSRNGLESLSRGGAGAFAEGFKFKASNQTDKVLKMWKSSDDNDLTQEEKRRIINAGVSGFTGLEILEEKRKEIASLKSAKGMTLGSNPGDGGFWRGQFEGWLQNMKGKTVTGTDSASWNAMITRWNDPQNQNNRTLENLFQKDRNYVMAYANLFKLGNVIAWSDLKDKDISKK